MRYAVLLSTVLAAPALALSTPVAAQSAGDGYVRVAAARTKLVDKGKIAINGMVDLTAGYKSRDTFHGALTAGYFPVAGVAVEASISTPATADIVPAGGLSGLPTLGDDEFTMVTLGANVQPLKGPVSPFVGAGYSRHFTTQERDGLGVNLTVPNTGGPYVQAGVDIALSPRWGVFASVRKAWYSTRATALLPTDATYTNFASVAANARLDPMTIQFGFTTRFGGAANAAGSAPIGTDTTKWTIRAGLTSLSLADKVKLDVGGAPYPGAGLSTSEHTAPTVQIGRFLTSHVAISLSVGIPPTIDIRAAGSIGALSKIGEVTYGATVLTAQYHFTRSGRVRPYVGVGAAYLMTFGTKDGAFQNLKVDNDLGWAFEAGSDLMISNRVGIFMDAKKALLRPVARGTFMGTSVKGFTRIDPWAFSGGVALHL